MGTDRTSPILDEIGEINVPTGIGIAFDVKVIKLGNAE